MALFDPSVIHDLLIGTGGGLLGRLPDLFKLGSEHVAKKRETEVAATESAGMMALGIVREMRERIEQLEMQLADRDRQMIEREKSFAAALGDQRHALRNLEARFATMTVIADMEPGPARDRMLERVLKSFETPIPPAIVK